MSAGTSYNTRSLGVITASPSEPVVWRRFGPTDRIGVDIGTPNGAYYRCIATDERRHVFESLEHPDTFKAFTHVEIAQIELTQGYRYDRGWFEVDRPLDDPTVMPHSTLATAWHPPFEPEPRPPSKPQLRKSSYIRVGPYPDKPPNYSSVRELMTRLKVGAPLIRALIANKIVGTETAENPLNKCPMTVVSDADIAEFQRRFVRLHELAGISKINHSRLKKILEQHHVKPAFNPQAFQAYIYPRHEARHALGI